MFYFLNKIHVRYTRLIRSLAPCSFQLICVHLLTVRQPTRKLICELVCSQNLARTLQPTGVAGSPNPPHFFSLITSINVRLLKNLDSTP